MQEREGECTGVKVASLFQNYGLLKRQFYQTIPSHLHTHHRNPGNKPHPSLINIPLSVLIKSTIYSAHNSFMIADKEANIIQFGPIDNNYKK